MPELGPISYCKLLLGSDTLEDCDEEQFVTNDDPVSDPPAIPSSKFKKGKKVQKIIC